MKGLHILFKIRCYATAMIKRAAYVLIPVFLSASIAYAGAPKKAVTPYGDSCPLCGVYGYCSKQPSDEKAAAVLRAHYGKKGLGAAVTKRAGRFLEAEIYRGNKTVDRILLDLRTGKIRSIMH